MPAPYWTVPTVMPMLPGNGLGQHPMLYAGEGFNVVFVINHGKVVWSYPLGSPGEIEDVWMMSNGDILVALELGTVAEYDQDFNLVWSYDIATPGPPRACTTATP
jgi:hypothetical protein